MRLTRRTIAVLPSVFKVAHNTRSHVKGTHVGGGAGCWTSSCKMGVPGFHLDELMIHGVDSTDDTWPKVQTVFPRVRHVHSAIAFLFS